MSDDKECGECGAHGLVHFKYCPLNRVTEQADFDAAVADALSDIKAARKRMET